MDCRNVEVVVEASNGRINIKGKQWKGWILIPGVTCESVKVGTKMNMFRGRINYARCYRGGRNIWWNM